MDADTSHFTSYEDREGLSALKTAQADITNVQNPSFLTSLWLCFGSGVKKNRWVWNWLGLCSLCDQMSLGSSKSHPTGEMWKTKQSPRGVVGNGEQTNRIPFFSIPIFVFMRNANEAHKYFQKMIMLLNETYIQHLALTGVCLSAYCMHAAWQEGVTLGKAFPHHPRAGILLEAKPMQPLPLILWKRILYRRKIPSTFA